MTKPLTESIRLYLDTHPSLRRVSKPAIKFVRLLWPSRDQVLSKSYRYLFENVIDGTLKLQVPDLGIFEVSGRSDILFRLMLHRKYEPRLMEILQSSVDPDRDAIDVGANVGLVTTILARLITEERKVLAIEPTKGAMCYLKRNIQTNNVTHKVILFEGVAEEMRGEFILKVFPGKEEYSTLVGVTHPSIKRNQYEEIRVAGDTIDHLVQCHNLEPGILKIDTEGAEAHVLRGARQTLLNHRPIILCESFPDEMLSEAGEQPGSIRSLLAECGYTVSICETDELLAIPREQSTTLRRVD